MMPAIQRSVRVFPQPDAPNNAATPFSEKFYTQRKAAQSLINIDVDTHCIRPFCLFLRSSKLMIRSTVALITRFMITHFMAPASSLVRQRLIDRGRYRCSLPRRIPDQHAGRPVHSPRARAKASTAPAKIPCSHAGIRMRQKI